MIKTETVLVLGAGASRPYGFPLASGLRESICRWADTEPAPQIAKAWDDSGISKAAMRAFADAFLRSRVASIDAFLEKRPEFAACGKLAIACEICSCEEPSKITAHSNADDWYSYLWNHMHRDVSSVEGLLTTVKIVTFNYDRSLEFMLFDSIKNTFGCNDEVALKWTGAVPTIHAYGSVGWIHYSEANEFKCVFPTYSKNIDGREIDNAIKAIALVSERSAANFGIARAWLEKAEHIAFLGFGFDRINCERLGLHEILARRALERKPPTAIYASTYGLTREDIDAARDVTIGNFDWQTFDMTNLEFLRNTALLRE